MRKLPLFLFVFLFQALLYAADNEKNSVSTEINAVLETLEKDYPSLMKKLSSSKEAKDKFMKRFISSFNAGIEYVPAEDELNIPEPVPNGKVESFNVVNIASNKVTYIRIDSFTPETVAKLAEDAEMFSGFTKKSSGIIIDLRNSSGGDNMSALKAAGFFCPPDKLPEVPELKGTKRFFKLPIVILTSGKTRNSSEIFVSVMEKAGSAMTIGYPTAGIIFSVKALETSSGSRLLIPDISHEFAGIQPNPIQPSIMENPFPQIDFKKLSSEIGSESSDRALSRAIDLLISIDVIRDRMKEAKETEAEADN